VLDIVLLWSIWHTRSQKKIDIKSSVFLPDLYRAVIRYPKSLLPFPVRYVITFTPSFIQSPECAYLSSSTWKPLFMFLHLIFPCTASYCIPHAMIKCRMNILISNFTCLMAWFFPREDCSIRPLVVGSEIALSARMQSLSFAGSPRCAFTLTKQATVAAEILFRSHDLES